MNILDELKSITYDGEFEEELFSYRYDEESDLWVGGEGHDAYQAIYMNERGETVARSYGSLMVEKIARRVGAPYYAYRTPTMRAVQIEGWNPETGRYRKITKK